MMNGEIFLNQEEHFLLANAALERKWGTKIISSYLADIELGNLVVEEEIRNKYLKLYHKLKLTE